MSCIGSRIVRICTFNTYENLWVNPSGLHAKLEKETEDTGTDTPTISNKAKGSIFCVCWDRTGQLLCRGSLDGSMSIVSTYYDPTQPFALNIGVIHRIQDCPFDIASKDLFGYVFGDKCDVVEAIAVNLSNTAIAYAGSFIRRYLELDRISNVYVLEFTGHVMHKRVFLSEQLSSPDDFLSLPAIHKPAIRSRRRDGGWRL